ncbi:hypothetical protein RQP46_008662 [Phenoliferia psychrophenolica]
MPSQYIPPPSTDEVWPPLEEAAPHKSTWDRFSRKFIEEPLVPIGILATCIALGGATSALQKGNRTQFNKFLRYRVAAQGVTVVAALGGSVFYQQERKALREQEKEARDAKLNAALAEDIPALAEVKV